MSLWIRTHNILHSVDVTDFCFSYTVSNQTILTAPSNVPTAFTFIKMVFSFLFMLGLFIHTKNVLSSHK